MSSNHYESFGLWERDCEQCGLTVEKKLKHWVAYRVLPNGNEYVMGYYRWDLGGGVLDLNAVPKVPLMKGSKWREEYDQQGFYDARGRYWELFREAGKLFRSGV